MINRETERNLQKIQGLARLWQTIQRRVMRVKLITVGRGRAERRKYEMHDLLSNPMLELLNKLYDDVKRILPTIRKSPASRAFVSREHHVSITPVDGWVVGETDIKVTFFTHMAVILYCKDIIGYMHPSINVVVEYIGSRISTEDYFVLSKAQLQNLEARHIIDASMAKVDNSFVIASVTQVPFLEDRTMFQFQKFIIRYGKAYIVTVTQLDEGMKEHPDVADSISRILQSFAIVDDENEV